MKKQIIFAICFALGMIVTSLFSCNDTTKKEYSPPNDTATEIQIDTFALNDINVYDAICDAGIYDPKIVLKQAILETGHFTSVYCKQYHNLFGFMTNNGCKKFDTYKDCIDYYKRWQKTYYSSKDYDTYYEFLDSINYAEDTTYIDKLKHIKIHV